MKKMSISRAAALLAAVSLIASGCQKTTEEVILPTLTETTTSAPEETDILAEETVTAPDDDEDTVVTSVPAEVLAEELETEAAGITPAARPWSETNMFGTMYITEDCYSRERAVMGSTPVAAHTAGDEVSVVALTDTGYYKLSDGSYIHSDYLSTTMPEIAPAETEPRIISTEPASVETEPPAPTRPAETEPVVTEPVSQETDFVFTQGTTAAAVPMSTVVNMGSYTIDFTTRYAYKKLANETEKQFYTAIVNSVMNMYVSADVPEGMSENDAIKVFASVYNNEPELFWLSGTVDIRGSRLRLRYVEDDMNEIKKKQKEIDSVADKLVKNVASMSAPNKMKYFHDFIIKNAVFSKDSTGYNGSVYHGVTAKGKLQCAGYAKTFSYLCDRAGVESITIVGTNSNNASHAWNVVNAGDGYYNVDCTWDDPVKSGEVDRGPKYIRYDYFLVPDKWLNIDHFDVNDFFINSGNTKIHLFNPPACTATANNYFTTQNMTYSNTASAKAAIKAQISEAVSSGAEVIEIRVTDKGAWDELMGKSCWKEFQDYAKSSSKKVTRLERMGADLEYNKTTGIVHYDIVYK